MWTSLLQSEVSGSHGGEVVDYSPLGFIAVCYHKWLPTFRKYISLPSSGFRSRQSRSPYRMVDKIVGKELLGHFCVKY